MKGLLRCIVDTGEQHFIPQFQLRILPGFVPRRIGQVEFQLAAGLLDIAGPGRGNQPACKIRVLRLFLFFRLGGIGIGLLIDFL